MSECRARESWERVQIEPALRLDPRRQTASANEGVPEGEPAALGKVSSRRGVPGVLRAEPNT